MNHGKARENDELSFRIANHSFTVVEADAGKVKLFETNTLINNTRTDHKCSAENQTRAPNATFFMLARPYTTGIGTFDNSTVAGIIEYEHQPLTSLKNRPLLRPWFPAINATNFVEVVLQVSSVRRATHSISMAIINFYVFGQGFDNFDPENSAPKFNLVDPAERNTIGVPFGAVGWVAIRFQADNPDN
ncbi:hypothetical protein V6N13_094477 [Hibiscus sabdariffa]